MMLSAGTEIDLRLTCACIENADKIIARIPNTKVLESVIGRGVNEDDFVDMSHAHYEYAAIQIAMQVRAIREASRRLKRE